MHLEGVPEESTIWKYIKNVKTISADDIKVS
jgi:hypothetical protein